MTKVGCIGAGYWGKNLIRNFYQIGALGAICDSRESVREAFKEQYPSVETYASIEELLSSDDIDAVSIATPAETHFSIGMEALKASKHVYVEKPLCLDENEAETLIEQAKERNLTLMVGHLLQYHPCYLKLKEIISEQKIGDLRYIYSNRLNIGLLRKEENVLWSFAPHDISMILGLVEDMPIKVNASGSDYLTQKVADVCVGTLEFKNNVNAHIFVSWLHPTKEQKLVVVGESGMLVFDDTLPWNEKLSIYDHKVEWNGEIPNAVKGNGVSIDMEEAEPLKNECQHFVDSIANSSLPRTDGSEGLRVLGVLNQLQQSIES